MWITTDPSNEKILWESKPDRIKTGLGKWWSISKNRKDISFLRFAIICSTTAMERCTNSS